MEAAAMRAAENGATTTHQLMAMLGWLNLAEARNWPGQRWCFSSVPRPKRERHLTTLFSTGL
jgi:hypothetical protein